ncbi:MAG: 50S ribosome-binding GTPase [Verrucomicrobia bacterium]|nr:50S ribosome-binding GTPase [Verrucomicrobiota bacterium]
MKQKPPTFIAADVSAKTKVLSKELQERLIASAIPEVQVIAPQVANALARDAGAALTLAFVGQYNAGKSTMIKALTGRDDIAIDADVCTNEVTAYSWHDLLLLDTPGVQAGKEDHDALTEQAILRSDLVVFVITAELFSDASARYFRHLMLDGGKAKESMLVVNKMTLDNGTEGAKRPDIDKVCNPLGSHDFSTVFMDAKCYLDSLNCADERDQRELREASGFDAFIDTLNRFILERCDLGRITLPLFQLRSISQQAAVITGADQPTERAAIELLGRLDACVGESKAQLKTRLKGALGRAERRIERAGDDLANAIHDEASPEEIKASEEASCQSVTDAQRDLADEAGQMI